MQFHLFCLLLADLFSYLSKHQACSHKFNFWHGSAKQVTCCLKGHNLCLQWAQTEKAKVLLALAQIYAFCWWIENQSTSHNSMLVEKLVLARKFTNWVRRKRKKQQNIHICLFLSVIKQCLSWSLTSITQLTSQWSRNETDEKHGSGLCRID